MDEAPTIDERGGDRSPPREHALPRRFTFVREIARGGMGRVIEAVDTELGRTVALKQMLDATPASRERFAREVAITARLEHPSIVAVYDAGTGGDGEPYYVMRRVSGAPLDAKTAAAKNPLALLPHVLAMADAVAHAHVRGVIHRDLKPSNVLVGELGETIVIDWGLAKLLDEADAPAIAHTPNGVDLRTRSGTMMGTPGFMAPEQILATGTDARCDVYALGATLFYVLARRMPLLGDETKILEHTIAGELPSLAAVAPGTPQELVTIVEKAMARDPADRYLDAGGFGEDLRRFLEGRLVASHRYGVARRISRWVRAHRAAFAVTGLAVAAVVTIFAVRRMQASHAAEQLHADDTVIAQARAELGSDPTRALATLLTLRADSPRWATLGPLVADARTRGVAMAYPWPSGTAALGFAKDGKIVATIHEHVETIDPVTHARVPGGEAVTTTRLVVEGNTIRDGDKRWTADSPVFASATADDHVYGLVMVAGTFRVVNCHPDGTTELGTTVMTPGGLTSGGRMLAELVAPREIVVGEPWFHRVIHAPLDVDNIALDPSGRWLVGSAPEHLLVWDLAYTRTELATIPPDDGYRYLDKTSLVGTRVDDTIPGRVIEIHHFTPSPFTIATTERLASTRDILADVATTGDGTITLLSMGAGTQVIRPRVDDAIAVTDAGHVLLHADGSITRDGKSVGALPGARDVTARAGWIVARNRTTIWRRDPAGRTTTRDIAAVSIELDDLGVAYIATETEIFAWDRKLFTSPAPILAIHRIAGGGLLVVSDAGSLVAVDEQHHRELIHLDKLSHFSFADDGTLAVTVVDNGVAAIDLRTGERWMVEQGYAPMQLAVSPDATELIAGTSPDAHDTRLFRWLLAPRTASPAEIRRITNARAGTELQWSAW